MGLGQDRVDDPVGASAHRATGRYLRPICHDLPGLCHGITWDTMPVYTHLIGARRWSGRPATLLGGLPSRLPVRTGLVAIGIVILVLGAGSILTLFLLSSGPSSTTKIQPEDPSLSPGFPQSWVVPGAVGGSGSISLSWTASSAADVNLWVATTCSAPGGFCPTGVAALNWTKSLSGSGTTATTSGSTYILIVDNPGASSLRFDGVVSVTYTPGTPVSPWSWALIAAGGIALLSIGGIALFLGLYLPTEVYRDADDPVVAVRHPSLPPEDPETEAFEDPTTDAPEVPP